MKPRWQISQDLTSNKCTDYPSIVNEELRVDENTYGALWKSDGAGIGKNEHQEVNTETSPCYNTDENMQECDSKKPSDKTGMESDKSTVREVQIPFEKHFESSSETSASSPSFSLKSDEDLTNDLVVDRVDYLQQFYRKLQAQHPKAPSDGPSIVSSMNEDCLTDTEPKSFTSSVTDFLNSVESYNRVEYLQNLHQDLANKQKYLIWEGKLPTNVSYVNTAVKKSQESRA